MSEDKIISDQNSALTIDKQVCFSLYSAANAMIRTYRPLLKKLDLTYPQYLVMLVLWKNNGINVKALGEILHLDSGTLTPLLKRLESKKLITRQRGKKDERVREIFLTTLGTDLKQQAQEIPNLMLCKSKLPIEQLISLKNSCDQLLKNLE